MPIVFPCEFLQHSPRQWVGTYAGRGNGDYRDELA